jgi:hypothetical protein
MKLKEVDKKLGIIFFTMLIFIGLVLISISNYKESSDLKRLQYGEQIFKIEEGYIVSYWRTPNNVDEVVNDFKEAYINHKKLGKEVYFIYNDGRSTYLMGCEFDFSGEVEIDQIKAIMENAIIYRELLHERDGKVKVSIKNRVYDVPVSF